MYNVRLFLTTFRAINQNFTMSTLIIGGTGFIGKALLMRLLDIGEYVYVFSRHASNLAFRHPKLKLIDGHLETFSNWDEVLPQINTVYHLASSSNPHLSYINPYNDIESYLIGTVRFLESCKKFPSIQIIFCSSGGTVYGPISDKNPISEEHPTNPISGYGIIKLSIEKYLQMYSLMNNLKILIFRVANPYGPFQEASKGHGIIATAIEKVLKGEEIFLYGDGSYERDFVFISDLIEAFIKAKTYTGDQQIMNIGTGRGTSVKTIIHQVQDVLKKEATIVYKPSRSFDVHYNVLNIDKAKKELLWKPLMPLNDGIQASYSWIKSNSFILK